MRVEPVGSLEPAGVAGGGVVVFDHDRPLLTVQLKVDLPHSVLVHLPRRKGLVNEM
jgi:hypothetical protein